MPNENDKTVVQAADSSTSVPVANAKPAGKKKLVLFAGIGLGAVVIGVALALFVLKPMLAPSDSEPETPATEKTEGKHAAKEGSHASKDAQGKGEAESLIYTIDDIVINPAGTGGSRFLSVSFGFELESPAVMGAFRSREAAIRDALITILSSKTVAQLTDVRQKEIIRYQIKKRVSEMMKTEGLAGVYYTDFVLQ